MSRSGVNSAAPSPKQFFAIRLGAIDAPSRDLDLFVWHDRTTRPVLYRASGSTFTTRDRATLLENGFSRLYAPIDQHPIYRAMVVRHVERTFARARRRSARRIVEVRHLCAELIEDVMQAPGRIEPVETIRDIARCLATCGHEHRDIFEHLLELSPHAYSSVSHMVNVGVGCGILARELVPDDDEFTRDCIVGGFLHDLGKRGVPEEVLLKEGGLDSREWRLIRRHPHMAFDELEPLGLLSTSSLEMIRDHHERLDGLGYPRGVGGDDLSLATRVCSIVDAFDAVASERPYRSAIDPLATIALMGDGEGTLFDAHVLRVWGSLIRRLAHDDASRASGAALDQDSMPLESLIQWPAESQGVEEADASGASSDDERRRFPRKSCRAPVRAMFLRQGKALPVLPGELFDLETLDVSKGGLLLESPWPFSRGDLVVLFVPQGSTRTLRLHARVVRVRRRDKSHWAIGVRFVAETDLFRSGGQSLNLDTRKAS